MKRLRLYEEFDVLPKRFYHGTHSAEHGEKIIEDGAIKPGNVDTKRGHKLTPKFGMTYLAPLEEAVVYTIGANMIGEEISHYIQSGGRYGYLFVIDAKELGGKKMYADEDYIGQAIYHLAKNSFYDEGFGHDVKNMSDLNKRRLLYFAEELLTPRQYQKVLRYDDYADFAVAGKKLMYRMDPEIHEELIALGSPAAIEGKIRFSEAWRFDKTLNPKLKKDASNFFDLAEKAAK